MGWHRVNVILHLSFFIWTSNATLLALCLLFRPFPRFPVCFLVISWVCILPNANAWYFTTISIPHVNLKCFPTPSNRYRSNKTSMQSHKCVCAVCAPSLFFIIIFQIVHFVNYLCNTWFVASINDMKMVLVLKRQLCVCWIFISLEIHTFSSNHNWRTPSMQIAESFHEITFECSVLRICAFLFSWELTFQTLHYIVAHTNIVLHIDRSIRFAQCDRCFHVEWKFFHKHQRMRYFRFA